MALAEFSLIEKYFAALGSSRADVLLGVGDDAAQLMIPNNMSLVAAIDTMVAGVHFPEATAPREIGYKLLAVNLSDMAAMGAEPSWFTLALTLPDCDEHWLAEFSAGMAELAEQHSVQLIGGDTTQGPLVLSLQAHGFVPVEQCLKRSGAKVGDGIYVTGTLGDAALGLKVALEGAEYTDSEYLLSRLNRPTPRVVIGMALRGVANSAIDISDGLLVDLAHICQRSGVGAKLLMERIPLSEAYRSNSQTPDIALSGGDDYELCFTAATSQHAAVMAIAEQYHCKIHRIGEVVEQSGIHCFLDGHLYQPTGHGYQHFVEQ